MDCVCELGMEFDDAQVALVVPVVLPSLARSGSRQAETSEDNPFRQRRACIIV